MFHTGNRISWPSMTLTKTPFFWTWFQRWKSNQLQMSHVQLNLLGHLKGGACSKVHDTSFATQIWAWHFAIHSGARFGDFFLSDVYSPLMLGSINLKWKPGGLDFSTHQTSPVLFALTITRGSGCICFLHHQTLDCWAYIFKMSLTMTTRRIFDSTSSLIPLNHAAWSTRTWQMFWSFIQSN